jgi:hypothetical protein
MTRTLRGVQFSIGQQSCVGRDPATVEFQSQPKVEIDRQGAVTRFTCWVFYPRASLSTASR